jgi:hypothetical protein
VSVSTTDISVLHFAEVVHFTMSRDSHFPRVCKAPKHFQDEQAGYTMKSFKSSFNKLGLLGFLGRQI